MMGAMVRSPAVSSVFVSVGGLRLHHLDHGGSGEPIVLVHGVTGHAAAWHAVAPHLTDLGRPLAVELRGHGDSQWSAAGDYATTDHVADLVAVLDALGHEQVTVVGSSWGALVAIGVASMHPARVGRLAVVDVEASFVDEGRPRRFDRATFVVTDEHGGVTRHEVEARGPAVAMQGLGYGGYDDGKGLGVYRGVAHHEGEVWDVSHPAEVTYPDGTTGRPVHRIQPVSVTSHGPAGISTGAGGLTFIAETGLDPDGRLRTSGGH